MTEKSIVYTMIESVSDPVLIITPKKKISNEEMTKVFLTIENLLEKIKCKSGIDFDIIVESSEVYNDYESLSNLAEYQKCEAEDELFE